MLKLCMSLLILIILLCAAVCIFAHFENRRFRITEYTIHSSKIHDPYTIAVLADLHNYEYGEGNSRLFDALKKIDPDIVISAGDMVEAGKFVENTSRTMEFMRQMSDEFDFVYGLGNHEWKLMHDGSEFRKASHQFCDAIDAWMAEGYEDYLDNRTTERKTLGLRIYGLNLEYDYFKKFIVNKTGAEHITELVGKPSDDMLNLLIGHNPDQIDAYAEWGADVVLSGHVHGGMVCLPGGRAIICPKFTLFPKYYAGVYHKDKTDMVVSRGLGNHSVHLRIFNRAEIVAIRMCPQE